MSNRLDKPGSDILKKGLGIIILRFLQKRAM
jgi:hypothetical protein